MSAGMGANNPSSPPVGAVQTASIEWFPEEAAAARVLRCPVCETTGAHAPQLAIPSMVDGARLTLYRCAHCRSKFYDPPGVREFSAIFESGDEHRWKSYVESIAGIWEMYWPAACAAQKRPATLLDVGCGFGFTVDAWQRLRGDAIGVEVAEYGRAGAEQLGVTIHAGYLQDLASLERARFDVVYASEVIEHVPDAREFARLLSRHVADDGVLCFTTPNAAYVDDANAGGTMIAALCPGFHGFLLSRPAMDEMLRDLGFPHVVVREFGERLIAWASRRPLAIDERSPELRDEYLCYLRQALAAREQDDIVADGIAYRHFRDTVLSGQLHAARATLARLERSLKSKYGDAIVDAPDRTVDAVRALATSRAFDAACPWFLPSWYFVRGLYAKLSERDEPAARRYFRASRELTLWLAKSFGSVTVLEALSFAPEAWKQEAVSAALVGDASPCIEWMAAVGAGGPPTAARFGDTPLSDRQVEQAYVEGLSILRALNEREALARTLADCIDYLDRRYGDWLPIEGKAAETVAGATLSHEERLLLHSAIARACTATASHAQRVRPLLEQVVRLGTLAPMTSQTAKAIIAEAEGLLRALPAPGGTPNGGSAAKAPIVSYSFRFVSKPNS
jgi:2-polyprenyl-3-methyl-5-hydroxy-6-metoxy-1,4-benzoquinol methylase